MEKELSARAKSPRLLDQLRDAPSAAPLQLPRGV